MHSIRENVLRAVSEPICRLTGDDAPLQKIGEIAVKGDLAQTYNDANARQSMNLIGKMCGAVTNLLGQRLISRRRAADHRGYPCVAEPEAIVTGDARWLAREAQLVEDGIHEGSGAVPGKRTTGPIGSMGARSEPEDQDACSRIAETGYRARPISLVLIGAAPRLADGPAIIAKA